MHDNKDKGNLGESIACDFLKKEGYAIVEKNYQKRIGEIDIIARRNDILHFVEVKTRSDSSLEMFGLPQDAVNAQKKRKIIRTALYYLQENLFPEDTSWQIDVIAITINWQRKKAKICFLENAVENF
ncbi:MAG: YraN family protein [Candidatus Paceibacterota bacterium]|jgi:putative endonuclease